MTENASADLGSAQSHVNARLWSAGGHLRTYDNANLLPAESLILARYREALTGRVLDLGCGAGRILGYLLLLGADALAIDLSPQMVERCRERFPEADVRVADLANLDGAVTGQFDALLLTANLIDVFDDSERRTVLAELRGLLRPGGLLIFSSHNLDHWDRPGSGRGSRLVQMLRAAARRGLTVWIHLAISFPQKVRNRRRLGPLQHRAADYAVINDEVHEYSLLHYYIGRIAQERQLDELGYELIDVLEADGPTIPSGEPGLSDSLYYVAIPRLEPGSDAGARGAVP
jgi:SAM-dependent methyltransferase